ncbi:MAG: fibronectin type III domain-containing protein [Deltaproteobacteria bacterium]|nr:fibronectin type III domain-containing protein [Deltaproteobacteria bacterium]
MTRRSRPAALVAGLAVVTTLGSPVAAEDGVCQVVDLDFLPAELATAAPMRPTSQLVAWLEEPGGTFVDTIFITETTGTYGLGNRPGRADFNSGPNWPYGRRLGVFPVWAHRHGLSFPDVVFQNGNEDNLSHPFNESSVESRFCRPLVVSEPQWDAGSCASKVHTDKGVLGTRTSNYPPRNDVTRAGPDHPSVEMFALLNPFDAVSQATPPSGAPAQLSWMAPQALPAGDYVLWLEVSREFDHNATYSVAARPAPDGIPWSDYGEPSRGQPSVLYQVPVTIAASGVHVASTLDYVGYGDPDGRDGNVRPPDSTITTGVAGSGAERLAIRVDGGDPYRLRVTSRVELDEVKPGAPTDVAINTLTSTSAIVELVAPGDDGVTGPVRGYEIRYVAGGALTEASFAAATELRPLLDIGAPGSVLEFPITGLLFDTEYTVGIRAVDDCRNQGPLALVTFRTPDRGVGEVDACFIATAAYGSVMANDVELLRRFRDVLLHETVLGELVVEAYYTFGPAVAGVVGESELLRATGRSILDPIVGWVRAFRL